MFLRQLSHSFPSFHLAIHIIAHLFNFERYSRSRQATDGSLASILSNLPHQENDSWLNPIQSSNTVSWFKGKASGTWTWAGRSWCPWWTLCLVEISPFIDSGVRDIHQHCWSHWSNHHNGSSSNGDFSYGIYPEELFWGLLVYTPHFYHLLHWLRNSWSWVRSSNSHFSCPHSWSCVILCHILSFFFCLSGIVRGQTEESMGENHPHMCAEFFEKWDDPASHCKPPQFEGLPAEVRPEQG